MAKATVTGKLEASDDTPIAGLAVTFTIDPPNIVVFGPDGSELLLSPVTVLTRPDGTYSASLERTDTMVPMGMLYRVTTAGQAVIFIAVPGGGGAVRDLITPAPSSITPLGAISTVRAGSGITVDSSDPQNPLVAVTTYSFVQSAPSANWTVVHNLGRYPSVTVVDGSGNVLAADVRYADNNTILIGFSAPQAGTVYLN